MCQESSKGRKEKHKFFQHRGFPGVLKKIVEVRKASFGIATLVTNFLVSLGHSLGIDHANFVIHTGKGRCLKVNGD